MKCWFIAATLGFITLTANAIEIGILAQDAYAKVQQAHAKVLLVDVRDPIEIMFTGFADVVHVNTPYLMVDRTAWDEKRGVYRLCQNPEFAAQIKAELKKRGLGVNAEIITMCRSGSERGKPSAAFLREKGFPNARYVIDGFQGAAIKDGPQTGFRLLNGWQNSGLPWRMNMNPQKMYRVDLQSGP